MAANSNEEDQAPKQSLYLIAEAEMKLLRRLRQLQAGSHLVIILVDGQGMAGLSVLGSMKVERLRPPSAGLV